MKIAILAWGSLLWEKGDRPLDTAFDWAPSGLKLPIELSRVSESRNGALTLVIDPKNGVEIPTYFAVSSLQNLNEAISNLRKREHTSSRFIGYVNCRSGK